MIRVLKISGYYFGKDKFNNDQYTVDGLVFDTPSNYVGNPSKRIWVKADKVVLSPESIGKTLFAEYNERGNIVKCEVK